MFDKKYITEQMKIPLSNNDIIDKLNNQVNVITYSELKKYNNIFDLLDNSGNLVILVEMKQGYGHWITVMLRSNKIIEVFDSYGLEPDDQLDYIDKQFKKNNNMYYPFLSKLLYNSNYNIEYNEHQLQNLDKNINTCGRWVIERIKLKNISINDFYNLFKSDKHISSDELVTIKNLI